jgi:predicted ATPase
MTALTQLNLKNFKSWRETGEIRLAPITAFFGSNSSGKTSLLQSLLLMKQTTESPDRSRVLDLTGPNVLVDMGTAQDIQFRHEHGRNVSLALGWHVDASIQVVDLLKRAQKVSSTLIDSKELRLETSINISSSSMYVEETNYWLGDAEFSMHRREEGGYELISDRYAFTRTQGRAWPLPPPARFYGFPDQVRAYFQNAAFLSDLELAFEQACSRIRYLGPLRETPKRQYIFSGGVPGDVGRRGELAVDALISSRLAGTKVSRGRTIARRMNAIPVEQLVAEWLSELGLIYSFEVETLDDRKTLFRVSVRRNAGSPPVLITDVGFGVSQVLPVLVLLAYAQPGDTVILEQPEIHLHPAVQAGLADVILEAALARNVQIILESHSEHLLARLQRRIAEQELQRGLEVVPKDVAIYFCDSILGESRLSELVLDDYGGITNWPKDFFGNPMEDPVATAEAAAQRRRNQL